MATRSREKSAARRENADKRPRAIARYGTTPYHRLTFRLLPPP